MKLAESRRIYIGGGSGFWGDSQIAMPQLLTASKLDYISFDYLAETTMSILQRARMRNPALGYATDFVSEVVKPHLREVLARNIRLVANAGGLNPEACRNAILEVAAKQGLKPRVAIVSGDDVLHAAAQFEPFSASVDEGKHLDPTRDLLSANAYLGAAPIVRALALDADIVITGRVVDSALVLAVSIFEFGWSVSDYDKLARASLAGHLIECGPQVTGGLFTDWQAVPNWANIGYPIVSISADGNFEVGKPENTGGLVTPATVGEQMLYEIGDPSAYELPDVVCDFTNVRIASCGSDRVCVTGARGRRPSSRYKVSATFQDGYQIALMMAIRGLDAKAKSIRTADELLSRSRTLMQEAGFSDYSEIAVELLGTEALYGKHARAFPTREIILRIAARHKEYGALAFLQKEAASTGVSFGPGTRGHLGGRAGIQDVIRMRPFYISKQEASVQVSIGECLERVEAYSDDLAPISAPIRDSRSEGVFMANAEEAALTGSDADDDVVSVPLVELAYARSGDKGDDANIGVIARHPSLVPVLRRELTASMVARYFEHLMEGEVTRYELPGINAFNFLLTRSLGGGGVSSLRSDPLGKAYAQMLLDLEIPCPRRLLGGRVGQFKAATASRAGQVAAAQNR